MKYSTATHVPPCDVDGHNCTLRDGMRARILQVGTPGAALTTTFTQE